MANSELRQISIYNYLFYIKNRLKYIYLTDPNPFVQF